jgi:hypothetical protein
MQELAQSQKAFRKDALNVVDESDDFPDELETDDSFSDEEATSPKLVLESAQRATSMNATSSLPSLRRELMDIRDLLSN